MQTYRNDSSEYEYIVYNRINVFLDQLGINFYLDPIVQNYGKSNRKCIVNRKKLAS